MKKIDYKELYRQWKMSQTKLTFTQWLDRFYPDRNPSPTN